MRLPRWRTRLRAREDVVNARLDDARRRQHDAEAETKVSQARLHGIRETVVRPLRTRARENNFAAILEASLARGYDEGNRP